MNTTKPISTRFSAFRFSLGSLRSPISPISPNSPKLANNAEQSLSICHSAGGSTPTARGTPEPLDKEKQPGSIGVTVVDGEGYAAPLATPNALPQTALSPITPWHASFHRNAASVDQETAYLKRTSILRITRLILAVLLFSTSITLTALEGTILRSYNETHLSADFYLSLWPTDINLRPTLLALSTGAITTLLALIAIIVAIVPSPSPRFKVGRIVFGFLCAIATVLSLSSVIVAEELSPAYIFGSFVSKTLTSLVSTTGPANTNGLTLNGHGSNPKSETIQSFTCAVSNTAKQFNADAQSLALPSLSDASELVPSGFGKICTESKASLAIVIVVLGLAVIGTVVAGLSWTVDKQIERLRGEREVLASRDGQSVPESLIGIPYEKRDAEMGM